VLIITIVVDIDKTTFFSLVWSNRRHTWVLFVYFFIMLLSNQANQRIKIQKAPTRITKSINNKKEKKIFFFFSFFFFFWLLEIFNSVSQFNSIKFQFQLFVHFFPFFSSFNFNFTLFNIPWGLWLLDWIFRALVLFWFIYLKFFIFCFLGLSFHSLWLYFFGFFFPFIFEDSYFFGSFHIQLVFYVDLLYDLFIFILFISFFFLKLSLV